MLLPEQRTTAARAFRDKNRGEGIVSDFAAGEVASALSRLVRTKNYSADTMTVAWRLFLEWRQAEAVDVKIEPRDVQVATGFVLDWSSKLRLPDALHLAVATRLASPFATLDKQLIEAGRRVSVEMITF